MNNFHKWEKFGRKLTVGLTRRPGVLALEIRFTNPILRRQSLAKQDGWRKVGFTPPKNKKLHDKMAAALTAYFAK